MKYLLTLSILILVIQEVKSQENTFYRFHTTELDFDKRKAYCGCIAFHKVGKAMVIEKENGEFASYLILQEYVKKNGYHVFFMASNATRKCYILRFENDRRTVLYEHKDGFLNMLILYEGKCK